MKINLEINATPGSEQHLPAVLNWIGKYHAEFPEHEDPCDWYVFIEAIAPDDTLHPTLPAPVWILRSVEGMSGFNEWMYAEADVPPQFRQHAYQGFVSSEALEG